MPTALRAALALSDRRRLCWRGSGTFTRFPLFPPRHQLVTKSVTNPVKRHQPWVICSGTTSVTTIARTLEKTKIRRTIGSPSAPTMAQIDARLKTALELP
jgi:hypothetical protein